MARLSSIVCFGLFVIIATNAAPITDDPEIETILTTTIQPLVSRLECGHICGACEGIPRFDDAKDRCYCELPPSTTRAERQCLDEMKAKANTMGMKLITFHSPSARSKREGLLGGVLGGIVGASNPEYDEENQARVDNIIINEENQDGGVEGNEVVGDAKKHHHSKIGELISSAHERINHLVKKYPEGSGRESGSRVRELQTMLNEMTHKLKLLREEGGHKRFREEEVSEPKHHVGGLQRLQLEERLVRAREHLKKNQLHHHHHLHSRDLAGVEGVQEENVDLQNIEQPVLVIDDKEKDETNAKTAHKRRSPELEAKKSNRRSITHEEKEPKKRLHQRKAPVDGKKDRLHRRDNEKKVIARSPKAPRNKAVAGMIPSVLTDQLPVDTGSLPVDPSNLPVDTSNLPVDPSKMVGSVEKLPGMEQVEKMAESIPVVKDVITEVFDKGPVTQDGLVNANVEV